MSRLGTVLILAVGALTLACGGDPEPDPTPPPDEAAPDPVASETEPVDPEWALDFEITGRSAPMTARAQLVVNQGDPNVHVEVYARTEVTDWMMLDLTFDGLEAVPGTHREQVGLPEGGPHAANGSLDDIWYYSQSGEVEFSFTPEGTIQGSFNIALARGEETPGLPVVFQADEVTTPLVGTFGGTWVLSCHSRLRGHDTLVRDGDYCETLTIGK